MFSVFCLLKVLLSLKVTFYSKLEKKSSKHSQSILFCVPQVPWLSWAKFSSGNLGRLVFQEIVLNSDNARIQKKICFKKDKLNSIQKKISIQKKKNSIQKKICFKKDKLRSSATK